MSSGQSSISRTTDTGPTGAESLGHLSSVLDFTCVGLVSGRKMVSLDLKVDGFLVIIVVVRPFV